MMNRLLDAIVLRAERKGRRVSLMRISGQVEVWSSSPETGANCNYNIDKLAKVR